MTTGELIKLRRKELGLSAEQVADALGVSPATIYRYENGEIEKVPGDYLVPLASVLCTTPHHLMGWDTDDCANLVPVPTLQSLLLSNFAQLNQEGQEKVVEYATDLVESGRYIKTHPSGLVEDA